MPPWAERVGDKKPLFTSSHRNGQRHFAYGIHPARETVCGSEMESGRHEQSGGRWKPIRDPCQ